MIAAHTDQDISRAMPDEVADDDDISLDEDVPDEFANEFDVEVELDVDEEDLESALEDGLVDEIDTESFEDLAAAEAAEDDDEPEVVPKRRVGDEDDDEEEIDPDDVEADLGEILRDRIAANDDEPAEDEDEVEPATRSADEDIQQRRAGEFACPSCFLLISEQAVARMGECPHCGQPLTTADLKS